MNHKCFALLAFLLLTAVCHTGNAQKIAEVSLRSIMDKMPKPPERLSETMETYPNLAYGEVPEEVKTTYHELDDIKRMMLKPLFDYFEVSVKKDDADKTYRNNLAVEEKRMLNDFSTLDAAWQNSGFYAFSEWIEYRPGISKQSWTKIVQPLSATGQGWYQQLLQMEKALATGRFLEEARPRAAMILYNPRIAALNEQFNKEKEALPEKKVKVFEGSDATASIKDPEQTIELFRKHAEKVQAAHKLFYEEEYRWWQENFNRVSTVALQMDELLAATGYGKNLSGNDRQLVPALGDVQVRILSMLQRLGGIGGKVVGIAAQARLSKVTEEDMIKGLKAFTEG
jgi:hypothetical protein